MKKKILLLLVILLTVITTPVFAKGDNGFFTGDRVKVKKNLNTTSFVAGNSVNMTSEVDGLNFVAGNNLTISSKQDYLFAAGNLITIKNATTKDAFIAGSTISIENTTVRDLYVGGSTITIDSNIERNTYIAGDSVVITGTINAAEKITIEEGTIIEGTLEYPEDAKLKIESGATITKKKTYKNVKIEKSSRLDILKHRVSGRIYSYISLILVAGILFLLNKKLFKGISKIEKRGSEIAKKSLIGFGILIMLPIASIIIMLTIIGLPLSLLALTIYIILIYLSSIATAYYCGNWLFKDKIKNEFLQLIVALAIIYVLEIIPFIGGLISFLSLIFGLGIYACLIVENAKAKK